MPTGESSAGPEMELVRRVRLVARWRRRGRAVRDGGCGHVTARPRNSSQSRMPYTILSHRASGIASGDASARIHRETSSARVADRVDSMRGRLRDLDAHQSPHRVVARDGRAGGDTSSRPAMRFGDVTRNTLDRSPRRSAEDRLQRRRPRRTACDGSSRRQPCSRPRATFSLPLMPPSMNSGSCSRWHHALGELALGLLRDPPECGAPLRRAARTDVTRRISGRRRAIDDVDVERVEVTRACSAERARQAYSFLTTIGRCQVVRRRLRRMRTAAATVPCTIGTPST